MTSIGQWRKGSKACRTGSDESPDSPLGSSDLPTLLQRSRGVLLCYWHLWVEVQTCHVGSRDTARVLCAYPVGMRILSPFSNFSASSSKGYRSTSLASQNGRLSSLLWFLWYECEWAHCLICLVEASDFCLNFIFARLSFLWIKLLVWLFVCLFIYPCWHFWVSSLFGSILGLKTLRYLTLCCSSGPEDQSLSSYFVFN